MTSQSNTAVMIWCYGSSVLDMTLSSIVKYITDADIYLLDAVEPDSSPMKGKNWQPHLKRWITQCLAPYGDRIKRIEWIKDYSNIGGAEWFLKFATEYPYEYIFKTDDDMFYTDYGLITALQYTLENENTLVSCALTPVQRLMPSILADRLGATLHKYLLSPRIMQNTKNQPELLRELWQKTMPPNAILPTLRLWHERDVFPLYGARIRWLSCHYLIKRTDYIPLLQNTDSDEKRINIAHRCLGKRIAVNTHHLVYHYSWRHTKKWTDENIQAILKNSTFWRLNETN